MWRAVRAEAGRNLYSAFINGLLLAAVGLGAFPTSHLAVAASAFVR